MKGYCTFLVAVLAVSSSTVLAQSKAAAIKSQTADTFVTCAVGGQGMMFAVPDATQASLMAPSRIQILRLKQTDQKKSFMLEIQQQQNQQPALSSVSTIPQPYYYSEKTGVVIFSFVSASPDMIALMTYTFSELFERDVKVSRSIVRYSTEMDWNDGYPKIRENTFDVSLLSNPSKVMTNGFGAGQCGEDAVQKVEAIQQRLKAEINQERSALIESGAIPKGGEASK